MTGDLVICCASQTAFVNMPLLRLQSSEGKFTNVSRNRACTQVLLQAWKLHVYRSGTFGAFWAGRKEDLQAPPLDIARIGCPVDSSYDLSYDVITQA